MSTREEILKIYNNGSEAVISKIQTLEERTTQQNVIITELKIQVKILKDQISLCSKLKEQMENIELQLKYLKNKE